MINLRKENDELRAQVAEDTSQFSQGEDPVTLDFGGDHGVNAMATKSTTWDELFSFLGPHLFGAMKARDVQFTMGDWIESHGGGERLVLMPDSVALIRDQLISLRLIDIQLGIWILTDKGKLAIANSRAVRRKVD